MVCTKNLEVRSGQLRILIIFLSYTTSNLLWQTWSLGKRHIISIGKAFLQFVAMNFKQDSIILNKNSCEFS